jgi:hypothetical protein
MSGKPENTTVGFKQTLEEKIKDLEPTLEAATRYHQGCVDILTAKKAVIDSAKSQLCQAELIHENVLAGREEPLNDPDVIKAKIVDAATAVIDLPYDDYATRCVKNRQLYDLIDRSCWLDGLSVKLPSVRSKTVVALIKRYIVAAQNVYDAYDAVVVAVKRYVDAISNAIDKYHIAVAATPHQYGSFQVYFSAISEAAIDYEGGEALAKSRTDVECAKLYYDKMYKHIRAENNALDAAIAAKEIRLSSAAAGTTMDD